jgi:hypothetical protein
MTTTQAPATTTQATSTQATPTFASRTLSTLALIGGVASLVFGQAVMLPIAAIILGVFGYRQEPSGRAFAVWGVVLSAFALFGWALFATIGFAFAAPWIVLGWF